MSPYIKIIIILTYITNNLVMTRGALASLHRDCCMLLKIEPSPSPICSLCILYFPPSEQDSVIFSRCNLEIDPPRLFAIRAVGHSPEKFSQVIPISDEIYRRPIKVRCHFLYTEYEGGQRGDQHSEVVLVSV